MEWIYLGIACLFFSIQFIFNKYFERYSDGTGTAGIWCAFVNALIMLIYLLPKNGFRFELSASALICALLYTLCSLLCTGVSILALSRGKLSIVTIYTLLGGLLLPFLWGIVMYDEAVTTGKIIGAVCVLASMLYSPVKQLATKSGNDAGGEGGKKGGLGFHLLCFILFLTNGIISIATTASQKASDAVSSDKFLLLCQAGIAVGALLCMIVMAVVRNIRGEKNGFRATFWEIAKKPPMTGKVFVLLIAFCALHSVCNGIGNIFSLNCAQTMDASIQFPVLSAVVIVFGALFGLLVFREPIEKDDGISLILSAAGIVFFIL